MSRSCRRTRDGRRVPRKSTSGSRLRQPGTPQPAPPGETRVIAESLEIQTLPSGPAAMPDGRKPVPRDGLSPSGATSTECPEVSTAQTWTRPSSPEPSTQIFPSGPGAIAGPSAAASGIVNSSTSPVVVIRPIRFVPVSGNQRFRSEPTAMSPGLIDSAERNSMRGAGRSVAAGALPCCAATARASRTTVRRHDAATRDLPAVILMDGIRTARGDRLESLLPASPDGRILRRREIPTRPLELRAPNLL